MSVSGARASSRCRRSVKVAAWPTPRSSSGWADPPNRQRHSEPQSIEEHETGARERERQHLGLQHFAGHDVEVAADVHGAREAMHALAVLAAFDDAMEGRR